MKAQGDHLKQHLQIATSDGRVKFVGQDGVECTASTASQSATRYLQFLPKKGALLRVTEVLLSLPGIISFLVMTCHSFASLHADRGYHHTSIVSSYAMALRLYRLSSNIVKLWPDLALSLMHCRMATCSYGV